MNVEITIILLLLEETHVQEGSLNCSNLNPSNQIFRYHTVNYQGTAVFYFGSRSLQIYIFFTIITTPTILSQASYHYLLPEPLEQLHYRSSHIWSYSLPSFPLTRKLTWYVCISDLMVVFFSPKPFSDSHSIQNQVQTLQEGLEIPEQLDPCTSPVSSHITSFPYSQSCFSTQYKWHFFREAFSDPQSRSVSFIVCSHMIMQFSFEFLVCNFVFIIMII